MLMPMLPWSSPALVTRVWGMASLFADAMPKHGQKLTRQAEGVIAHVRTLQRGGGDGRSLVRAASELADFAACGYRSFTVKAGAVPLLVALLESGSEDAKAQAARALSYLTTDKSGPPALLRAGGVAPLVALLRSGGYRTKEFAARALRNLAYDEAGNAAIVAIGIAPLVDVANGGGRYANTAAATALSILALSNEDAYVAMAEASGALVQLALGGFVDVARQRWMAGAAARAAAARILAARRAVVVRKCVETAVPEEIAGVVASFLARWG